MKKTIRLTESELTKLISKVVKETQEEKNKKNINELEHFFNPEALSTGKAIATIIGTVIGLLGIAGYDYLLDLARALKKKNKDKQAEQIISFVEKHKSGNKEESNEGWMEEGDDAEDFGKAMMEENFRRRTKRISRK